MILGVDGFDAHAAIIAYASQSLFLKVLASEPDAAELRPSGTAARGAEIASPGVHQRRQARMRAWRARKPASQF